MGHRKGDPRPDEQVQVEPGMNTLMVQRARTLSSRGRCNMTDPDAVAERYEWFLDMCESLDIRPTVEGLQSAYGYSRQNLRSIVEGDVKSVPEASIVTLKRAWNDMNWIMSQYSVNGHLNPAIACFMLKNHFGYKDETETIIVKKDPYESGNPEEIARKYLSGMAPALDVPQENARADVPLVETVVVDQTGTVE